MHIDGQKLKNRIFSMGTGLMLGGGASIVFVGKDNVANAGTEGLILCSLTALSLVTAGAILIQDTLPTRYKREEILQAKAIPALTGLAFALATMAKNNVPEDTLSQGALNPMEHTENTLQF